LEGEKIILLIINNLKMSCCCTSIFDLCTVPSCDEEGIKLTDLLAEQEGEYILKISFLDTDYNIRKEFLIDEEITFPTTALNEYQEYIARLYSPDGEQILYEQMDCIQFTVKPIYELSEIETGSP
jgi:hypothetical protein